MEAWLNSFWEVKTSFSKPWLWFPTLSSERTVPIVGIKEFKVGIYRIWLTIVDKSYSNLKIRQTFYSKQIGHISFGLIRMHIVPFCQHRPHCRYMTRPDYCARRAARAKWPDPVRTLENRQLYLNIFLLSRKPVVKQSQRREVFVALSLIRSFCLSHSICLMPVCLSVICV